MRRGRVRAFSAASIIEAMRAGGSSRSMGTYAAPVRSTANNVATMSAERGRARATMRSGPAPRVTSSRARRSTRASSSAKVSRWSPQTSAMRSGTASTARSNRSAMLNPIGLFYHPNENVFSFP